MKLTDHQKRVLTELFGECFHEWEWIPGNGLHCKNCPIDIYGGNPTYTQVMPVPTNRSFTTDADMLAVYRALFKKGMWEEFCNYMMDLYVMDHNLDSIEDSILFTAWLFSLSNPSEIEEMMVRVCEFIEWKGEN